MEIRDSRNTIFEDVFSLSLQRLSSDWKESSGDVWMVGKDSLSWGFVFGLRTGIEIGEEKGFEPKSFDLDDDDGSGEEEEEVEKREEDWRRWRWVRGSWRGIRREDSKIAPLTDVEKFRAAPLICQLRMIGSEQQTLSRLPPKESLWEEEEERGDGETLMLLVVVFSLFSIFWRFGKIEKIEKPQDGTFLLVVSPEVCRGERSDFFGLFFF